METQSEMSGQDNCGLDTSQSGAQVEPVSHMSGDRPYPRSLGLRCKACPPSRRGISPVSQIEGPCQGQVDRCLTLLCTMDPTPRENASSESGALPESPVDTLGVSLSQTSVLMPVARPGQSAGRDRTQSWWDVFPAVPRCESQVVFHEAGPVCRMERKKLKHVLKDNVDLKNTLSIPVVPHKAVAEVSRIGNV